MSRPSELARWATSGIDTEPTEAKKDVGFTNAEKPPGFILNWLFNLAYLWIQYFDLRIIGPKANDGTSLWKYTDSNGNVRSNFDSAGYLQGPIFNFQENWTAVTTLTGTTPQVVLTGTQFYAQLTGSALQVHSVGQAGTGILPTYPLSQGYTYIPTGTATSNTCAIRTGSSPFFNAPYVSAEMIFDAGVSNTAGSNNLRMAWGFFENILDMSNVNFSNAHLLFDRSVSPNWQFFSSEHGVGDSIIDTGIPVVANQMYRCRIQLHGSTTALGRCAILNINGNIFSVTTGTAVPTEGNGLFFGFVQQSIGTTSGDSAQFCGPVTVKINSFLDGTY